MASNGKPPSRLAESLPPVSEDSAQNSPTSASSISPTSRRGHDMVTSLAQNLRPQPLMHVWTFWYEKPPNSQTSPLRASTSPGNVSQEYDPDNLKQLHSVETVQEFWATWNNISDALQQQTNRSAWHLYHTTVHPTWESPRNVHGGAWTFRVPKAQAVEFYKEICGMAVGNWLQRAVENDLKNYNDDICGVSLRPRFAASLITIWNRYADNEAGRQRILDTVLKWFDGQIGQKLRPEDTERLQAMKPKEGSYYYKRHSEHDGFDLSLLEKVPQPKAVQMQRLKDAQLKDKAAQEKIQQAANAVDAVAQKLESLGVQTNESNSQGQATGSNVKPNQ